MDVYNEEQPPSDDPSVKQHLADSEIPDRDANHDESQLNENRRISIMPSSFDTDEIEGIFFLFLLLNLSHILWERDV